MCLSQRLRRFARILSLCEIGKRPQAFRRVTTSSGIIAFFLFQQIHESSKAFRRNMSVENSEVVCSFLSTTRFRPLLLVWEACVGELILLMDTTVDCGSREYQSPSQFKMKCNQKGLVKAADLCRCKNFSEDLEIDWGVQGSSLRAYYIFIAIISIFVLLANASLLVGIVRDPNLRSLHNLLVAGQAFCDLLVGITVFIFTIGPLFAGYFPGQELGCKAYALLIVTSCHATVMSLAFIAYSRKKRIVDNVSLRTREMLLSYCAVVGGSWVGLFAVYGAFTEARLACSSAFCNPLWQPWSISLCAFFIGAPIGYIVWTYRALYLKIRATRKQVSQFVDSAEKTNKTTILLLQMTFGVLVSWLPLYFWFLMLMIELGTGKLLPTTRHMEFLVGVAAILSSLISPIIYGMKNKTLQYAMRFAFVKSSWKEIAIEREKLRAFRRLLRSQISVKSKSSIVNHPLGETKPCPSGISTSQEIQLV